MDAKGSPQRGLFGATLGFFAGFAAVALFGPTASRFNEVMQLSPVMVGFLVAIPSLSGSLLRVPFGAWVDTSGGRKPFLVLLWLSVAGMLGLLLMVRFLYPERLSVAVYPLLLALGVLCGCGIATFSVGIGQVSYWFPQNRQGAALGVYAGVGNLAPGLFSLFLPLALLGWGLDGAYLAWFVFLVAGAALYQVFGMNAYYFQLRAKGLDAEPARQRAVSLGQEIFPKGGARQSLETAARQWKTWCLVAIYFATFGGFIALTAWFPTYWRSFFGVSAVAAGGLAASYSLTASVVRIAAGSLADKLGGERTTLFSLGAMLAGAAMLVFSHSYHLSLSGMLVMAVGMGAANAAVFKLIPQYVKQAVGGAAGWVGGLGAFGGFAIPPVMGGVVRFMGDAGYAAGFAVFVILALLSIGLAYVLKQSPSPAPAPVLLQSPPSET